MNADERREYLRVKQAEYRERVSSLSTTVDNVSDKYTPSTHTEADTEADTKKEHTRPPKKPEGDPHVREFLEWFPTEYAKRRNGATFFVQWPKDAPLVKRLLAVYPIERLKRHVVILLTTDEEWVESTDRGIGILSSKINWLEERLAAWEAKQHGRQATSV